MKNNKMAIFTLLAILSMMFVFFSQTKAFAHCDTLDGPVVKDARIALEKGDVTPVLKWVKQEREAEVQSAFALALAERVKSEETKEQADLKFFETIVRIHREDEGASFTGLKPAGTVLEPAVAEADKALESGSAENLVSLITADVTSGIQDRFILALEKQKHKDESVEAGREYMEAYVEFVHYVERIHLDAKGAPVEHNDKEHTIQ